MSERCSVHAPLQPATRFRAFGFGLWAKLHQMQPITVLGPNEINKVKVSKSLFIIHLHPLIKLDFDQWHTFFDSINNDVMCWKWFQLQILVFFMCVKFVPNRAKSKCLTKSVQSILDRLHNKSNLCKTAEMKVCWNSVHICWCPWWGGVVNKLKSPPLMRELQDEKEIYWCINRARTPCFTLLHKCEYQRRKHRFRLLFHKWM